MDAKTAGTKLAAVLDEGLVRATTTAETAQNAVYSFWSAFTAELERRRAARTVPAPQIDAKPF